LPFIFCFFFFRPFEGAKKKKKLWKISLIKKRKLFPFFRPLSHGVLCSEFFPFFFNKKKKQKKNKNVAVLSAP